MALLNEYYIFVQDEDVRRGVSISSHPVEKGLDITDNVKREPMVISITGEIVGTNATKVMNKITTLHQKGNYVKYVGRNILKNAVITSFDTSHPNTIYGGCSFTMEITEIRVAKTPLVVKKKNKKKTKSGTKQVTKKSKKNTTVKKYTVKRGDTLWAIAKKYYGNGASYPKIVNVNKDKIKNPNLIQIGWVLKIPT